MSKQETVDTEERDDFQAADLYETQQEPELEGSDEGDLELTAPPSMSLAKNDRSLAEFFRWYQKGKLVVDPEWQRRYVWDRKRASRLIESFLIDLPVPVVYLAVNAEGAYEVIDGLQRLTSVFDFFNNKYALTGLEIQHKLNSKKFNDLNEEQQSKLEDTTIRTFELAQTTPKDLMFIIFERLNTGGVALNDMEIRNCLFRGKLNDVLKDLARDDNFLAATNQKGLERRMKDRTLVLRFLAFYQLTYSKAKKGLKQFFNEFIETYRNPPDAKLKEFAQAFRKAMRVSYTVFGDKAFRLRRETKSGGEWTPNLNASVFQVLTVSFAEYDIGALTRAADSIFEAYVDLIATDEKWTDCVQRTTGEPSRIEYAFSTWNERLKGIMRAVNANDTTRCFSRSLKEEMYQQDNICHICGQKIVLVNDAALDHIEQYWQGGRTIPENARLLHRTCNMKRSRLESGSV